MLNAIALISMLHETSARHSARRRFRGRPVVRWTLDRLSQSKHLQRFAILCWLDQVDDLEAATADTRAIVCPGGPRVTLPALDAISAARRWSDGWRGGLLATCEFDRGFYGPWAREAANALNAQAAVLVDPSAALVDPELIDQLIEHADTHESSEICFSPAAPGLIGPLIRMPLLERLAATRTHPGRLLHYLPDQLSREMLAGENCLPTPSALARTTQRFTLDSDRQIERIATATAELNGQLASSGAEEILRRIERGDQTDSLPRELILELTPRRNTRPIFWPGRHLKINRPDMTAARAATAIESFARADDARLTLAGVGDPLLNPDWDSIVGIAADAGVAVHVETDLVGLDAATVDRLGDARLDVVSVHLPAFTAPVYQQVMGIDAYGQVLENLERLVKRRAARGAGLPLVVPIFTKCAANLAEMETWYDQWLRAVGSAVIAGPGDCAGQIPDLAVADMAPPRRRPCARLQSRMMILSDGRAVACEQDVLGKAALGNIRQSSLTELWTMAMNPLRQDHRLGQWQKHPLCGNCREWHRP